MTVHTLPQSSNLRQPALQERLAPQSFPKNAHAVIYRPTRSAMTSGKARTRDWKLRFERRAPPFIEPLMGWTGGDDTLAGVELTFPSAELAVSYARSQGLNYTVHDLPERKPELCIAARSTESERSAVMPCRQPLEWVERRLGPDVIREGFGPRLNPTAHCAGPRDVLNDPGLDDDQKRDLLERWVLDAYLLDLAFSSGAFGKRSSCLQDAIDALTVFDATRSDRGVRARKENYSSEQSRRRMKQRGEVKGEQQKSTSSQTGLSIPA